MLAVYWAATGDGNGAVSANQALFVQPQAPAPQVQGLIGDVTFQFVNHIDSIMNAAQTTTTLEMGGDPYEGWCTIDGADPACNPWQCSQGDICCKNICGRCCRDINSDCGTC